MRLPFGYEISVGKRAPNDANTATGMAQSRREYQGSPWNSVLGGFEPFKLIQNYQVYHAIREAMPFVDVGLRKFARLCNGFGVTCDNDATAEAANEWLAHVRINDRLRGFNSWSYRHINSMLEYGRGVGETVIANSGRDVYQLVNVKAAKVRLGRDPEGNVVIGESDNMGRFEPYENQDLITYNTLNGEDDSLFGVSMLRSIPFVANTVIMMEQALQQMWQRHGAPAFAFIDQIPADAAATPERVKSREASLRTLVQSHFEERRKRQSIMDFTVSTYGDLKIQTIGADMEPLEFEVPYRALMEQVVAVTELAPFMLGIQWSTTERLSQQQGDQIVSAVTDVRAELEPDYMRILETWQAANGLRGTLQAEWADVSLQDVVETARADFMEAQAAFKRTEVAEKQWRFGWLTQEEAAEFAGVEAEEMAVVMDMPPSDAPAGFGFAADPAEEVRQAWQNYPS